MIEDINVEEILVHAQSLTGYKYEMVVSEDRVEFNVQNIGKEQSSLQFKLERYDSDQIRVSSSKVYGDNTVNQLESEIVPMTTDAVVQKITDLYNKW